MKIRFASLVALVFSFFCLVGANASDDPVKACVKYQRADYSWSHGYSVTGFLLDGSELNRLAETYKYQSYRTYYVIIWKEGGYSALDLYPYSDLRSYEQDVEDQRDRKWRIKEGWDYCY